MKDALIRKIGFITQKDNGTVDISICNTPLNDATITEFNKKNGVLLDLRPVFVAFESLVLNHSELTQIPINPNYNDVTSGYIEGLETLTIATQKISNFLSSANFYLSIAKPKLENLFGSNSPEFRDWDDTRKKLHSENFSYKFSYALRNYSQHYGLPLSSIKLDQNNLLTPTPTKEIRIVIDTTAIFQSSYAWKNTIKEDAKAQQNPIDVIKLCNHYMHIIRKLHQKLLLVINGKVAELDHFLDRLREDFNISHIEQPIFFVSKYGDDPNNPSTQQEIPPFVEIKRLKEQRLKNDRTINEFSN